MALVAVGDVASVGFNEMVWLLHRSPLQHTMLQSSNNRFLIERRKVVKVLQPSVTSAVMRKKKTPGDNHS